MKYYLIVGEASGDLHASHLMAALKERDPQAEFRFYGGEKMQAQGGTLVRHYKDLAYMGFIQVALHAKTILQGLKACKHDILTWQPHALILVDYPGFNLKIAKYVHQNHLCPVFYYIAPKIWAWKEHRINNIRRDVDCLLSILPFEKDFYEKKHHYPIHYVGNPTMDEVREFETSSRYAAAPQQLKHVSLRSVCTSIEVSGSKPTLALLAGSRKQEIKANLPIMLKAVEPLEAHYHITIAGAPNIEADFYHRYTQHYPHVEICYSQTFQLLSQATAALVTSGTATLETALFGVPQVVCYATNFGHIVRFLKPHFLKVKYISLVNLILNTEAVPELIGSDMNPATCRSALQSILPKQPARQQQLYNYALLRQLLGTTSAPQTAAEVIVNQKL